MNDVIDNNDNDENVNYCKLWLTVRATILLNRNSNVSYCIHFILCDYWQILDVFVIYFIN